MKIDYLYILHNLFNFQTLTKKTLFAGTKNFFQLGLSRDDLKSYKNIIFLEIGLKAILFEANL